VKETKGIGLMESRLLNDEALAGDESDFCSVDRNFEGVDFGSFASSQEK